MQTLQICGGFITKPTNIAPAALQRASRGWPPLWRPANCQSMGITEVGCIVGLRRPSGALHPLIQLRALTMPPFSYCQPTALQAILNRSNTGLIEYHTASTGCCINPYHDITGTMMVNHNTAYSTDPVLEQCCIGWTSSCWTKHMDPVLTQCFIYIILKYAIYWRYFGRLFLWKVSSWGFSMCEWPACANHIDSQKVWNISQIMVQTWWYQQRWNKGQRIDWLTIWGS